MSKKRRPHRAAGQAYHNPSAAQEETYRRVLDAIAFKRRNPSLTLSEAARRSGTSLSEVREHGGFAVTFRREQWTVTPHDTLVRRMRFLTPRGYVTITTRDSEDASFIADYHNAVREYLITGNARALKPFEDKYIRTEEGEFDFVTDPAMLNRLARAGEVYFLDIYGSEGD